MSLIEIPYFNKSIKIRIILSNLSKKIRLKSTPDGFVSIMPKGSNISNLNKFLERNSLWVNQEIRRVRNISKNKIVFYKKNKEVYFKGMPLKIFFENSKDFKKIARIDKKKLIINTSDKLKSSLIIKNWLKFECKKSIIFHLEKYSQKLNIKFNKIYIRNQRTKWGGASSKKNLSFNWRLILAPNFVLEYIVVHEILHIIVPNHSREYWLKLKSIYSKTEEAKNWLRKNENLIYLDIY